MQEKLLLLHEIKGLLGEVSDKRLRALVLEILYESLHSLSVLSYFIDEAKFNPQSNNFSVDNEKVVMKEIDSIKKSIEKYLQKLIKKSKIEDKKLAAFNSEELLESIKSIKNIVKKYINCEKELTLLVIQNWYIGIHTYLEKAGNFNDFTKFFKTTIQPSNWLTLAALYISGNSFLWLSGYKEQGPVQNFLKVCMDTYSMVLSHLQEPPLREDEKIIPHLVILQQLKTKAELKKN